MMFIVLTLSIVVGIMLSTGLSIYLLMQPKVVEWYMKWVMKQMERMTDMFEKLEL